MGYQQEGKDAFPTFEEWWHELEGFALRAERGVEEIFEGAEKVTGPDIQRLEKWLRAAWDQGRANALAFPEAAKASEEPKSE